MNVHFILHVPFETPGTLIEWCRENDHKISFTKIYESSFFIPLSEIDLMVIMGGPMSVHDEEQYEWLKVEKLFIESYIATGKKVLGICLGSQLLAEVLGSRVFQNEEKEIGWWPVTKMEHSILRNIPGSFETFHWHGENFDLPKGAQLLFSSEGCRNQGFLVGSQIAALQFHMEMDPTLMKAMITHGKDEIQPAKFIQAEEKMNADGILLMSKQKELIRSFLDCFLNL